MADRDSTGRGSLENPALEKSAGEKMPNQGGFSRREFIKGTGLAGVAVSAGALLSEKILESAPSPGAAGSAKTLGPGPVAITLRINRQERNLEVEPRVTLLDALRDRFDLTGAKKVCDRATCGSCTVIADGRAIYSCAMLAIDAEGRDIRTIEGLAPEGSLHPVSQAFVNNDAQQCGFCTPGFVMACTAYLEHTSHPSYEGLQKALGGNLCRCGTYMGVRHAILDAARTVKGGRA